MLLGSLFAVIDVGADMPNVVLMAGPMVDLSAVANALATATGLHVVSPGDVLRGHVQQRTPLGVEATRYMRAGHLVPDELTAEAIADALAEVDGGWVLYGYPRRIRQAELLAQRGHAPDVVIELVLTANQLDVAIRRRVERQMELDPQQAERRQELLLLYAHYQENYQEQTEPLRGYYRTGELLRTASGFGDCEETAARLIPFANRR